MNELTPVGTKEAKQVFFGCLVCCIKRKIGVEIRSVDMTLSIYDL